MFDEGFDVIDDAHILVDGRMYGSWDELAASGYFHEEDTRCGVPSDELAKHPEFDLRGPADCSYNNTSVLPQYEPGVERYRIPVVVHVIQNSSGTGYLSEARVQSQIDILNEDYLALTGTNGALGNNAEIEFYLATEDPSGNPTNGITYSTNTTWFNDSGAYYNTLAWNTNKYLNIYTNQAGGALGYVPDLPQGGIAGSNSDRVVILYSSFGRNAPLSPYDQGRTATHEVGHYLGLWHPFDNGCGTVAGCATTGDRICDTNTESSPVFGCPGSHSSCSTSDPFHNYMDYSDDLCMTEFTPDQVNRMRCSLLNYRPNLYEVVTSGGPCNAADLDGSGVLNLDDVNLFAIYFQANDIRADVDGNGALNLDDVNTFALAFAAGCP
ncbi:MAG: zinc metalloprotease [Phycisphaerales bacterium]